MDQRQLTTTNWYAKSATLNTGCQFNTCFRSRLNAARGVNRSVTALKLRFCLLCSLYASRFGPFCTRDQTLKVAVRLDLVRVRTRF